MYYACYSSLNGETDARDFPDYQDALEWLNDYNIDGYWGCIREWTTKGLGRTEFDFDNA
jgi:hypothetical protein